MPAFKQVDRPAPTPDLAEPVAHAWRAFGRAARVPYRVSPAVPILFFGDVDAYCSSPLRILTVGLSPSPQEFPARMPFQRFPLASSVTATDQDRYVRALSAYFRTAPYQVWFRNFEPLLNGARSNYYPGWNSTVLHTDICSPVAANPTWSKLPKADQETLKMYGLPLWHMLLEQLRPHIVVISVAEEHLDSIMFEAHGRWAILHTFDHTASGTPRSRPYQVRSRWHDVGGDRSLFVFCPAGRTPLTISDNQKREVGAVARQAWSAGA